MIRFLVGVIVGVLLFFLFIYFGGGKMVKKIGDGLTDTGKKMEIVEEVIRKEKGKVERDVKKKIFKEESGAAKKGQ